MSADVVDLSTTESADPDDLARATISTIGQDRPGLVSGITALVTDLHLSIDDSRMSILGGDFAVLMSVTGAAAAIARLETQLSDYCAAQGLVYLFRAGGDRLPVNAQPCEVTVSAMDHPGIVRNVAAFFSDRHINILDLATETQPAAHTGIPIFSLRMTVEVPATEDMTQLKHGFDEFCLEQDLDGEMGAAAS